MHVLWVVSLWEERGGGDDGMMSLSPYSTSFHESETALHEKYDDGHDEQEKVVDVFRMLVVM